MNARDAILVVGLPLWIIRPLVADEPSSPPREAVLFDFEHESQVKAWSNLEAADAKPKGANPADAKKEPPAKIELSTEHASQGKQSLKVTFAGGYWPTITTTQVPEDWMPYSTFRADVTVRRHCVVGFAVLQEKSQRGGGWDATVSRWTVTQFLKPGLNTVIGTLHDPDGYYSINKKLGKVVRMELLMYQPHEGESIYVDNIRISTAKEVREKPTTKFRVLGNDVASLTSGGEDLTVPGVRELGQKLKAHWQKPVPKTLEQVEADFRSRFDELKKSHPKAVLAVFRDGQSGYDPAHPDKVYAGWKDAYWSSHGPDAMTVERSTNTGRSAGHEVFMRHRSPLMRVDLATIPTGSQILAARLIVIRAYDQPVKEHSPEKPNMWVVEPCNRPWDEYEVNAYQYARDKFWKAIGGAFYGDDPDFSPIYLAHGPSQGKVNHWDLTDAVRFWTDGQHANHGFMLHGDAGDWLVQAHAREAKEIKDRPAVWAIYEPAR